MKVLFVVFALAGFLFSGKFNSENAHKSYIAPAINLKSDTVYIRKDLPLYVANPCIEALLKAIEISNAQAYNPQLSFYGLYLNNRDKYRYMEVYIDKWSDTKDTTYAGVLKIGKMRFLFTGDVEKTNLFRKTSDKIQIKLVNIKRNEPERKDIAPNEPSLQGTFKSCDGLPLYVEVFTANSISGYQMDIKR